MSVTGAHPISSLVGEIRINSFREGAEAAHACVAFISCLSSRLGWSAVAGSEKEKRKAQFRLRPCREEMGELPCISGTRAFCQASFLTGSTETPWQSSPGCDLW